MPIKRLAVVLSICVAGLLPLTVGAAGIDGAATIGGVTAVRLHPPPRSLTVVATGDVLTEGVVNTVAAALAPPGVRYDYGPLFEPVRSLVWVRGRVREVSGADVRELLDLIAAESPNPDLLEVGSQHVLLLVQVDSVVVADATGAEPVAVAALLAAQPAPFCELETAWLRHLDSDQPEVIARLAGKLPASLRRGRVRPLGLDRYGVRLRVEGADGDHDVRLPFLAPVQDVAGLGRAIRVLMGCPFVNGLRARRV